MDEELATFDMHSSPDSIAPTSANEGTNAIRFAMMASLVPVAARPQLLIAPEDLAEVGINPDLASRFVDAEAREREYREAEYLLSNYRTGFEPIELRYAAFAALSGEAQIYARLALLAAGLGSRLERESATAASAILTSVPPQVVPPSTAGWRGWPYRFLDRRIDSLRFAGPLADFVSPPDEDGNPVAPLPWDGDGWERYCSYWLRDVFDNADPPSLLAALRFLAQVRADLGQRSGDPIVRELSFASFLNQPDGGGPPPLNPELDGVNTATIAPSTMVHGTWGWKGSWWYPGGDFHSFVAAGVRPALYAGGQEFAWSGAYSGAQRATGGHRFARWAAAAGGSAGLGTVFGHSYGAEVVARAVNAGSQIDEVVFLSAPIHSHHRQMLGAVRRVVDVRLKFDIVLLAARASQKLPAASNVTKCVLKPRYWSHGATHNPQIWATEGIAAAVGL
ncbi:hypothetical protein NQ152_09995 [Microbacterium sp. zg.B48]|uniref:hypothetical protein n=1 Tax=Microbacterium sp. zg.B48 TaxID=2969408 RepID=UPI00214C7B05|nr:hypothetical protein [Microbacterium sp. zg.B48]MCR2763838.1 hypothetical protein [Microbacterium sp. zg.B48]